MKAFIIHTGSGKSLEYANRSLDSFCCFRGWSPQLFQGVTPSTLPEFEERYPLEMQPASRAADFLKQERHSLLAAKKSCSLNHYRLFKICAELGEPIAVIEHDSMCVGDWPDEEWQDILVLNADSAFDQDELKRLRYRNLRFKPGVNKAHFNGLYYTHDTEICGAVMMPGTAAYAVTPKGAEKMVTVYEKKGWEQSDYIINSAHVEIETLMPELFTFILPNLKTSWGMNL